jgi:Flp pilus assembly secretin CpaC
VLLNGFRIPALSTRRTETELELENHQTFAIAGLLNNSVNATMQKIPGIGDIPILGALFRSKAAQKDQTELVVMITPEILPNNSTGAARSLPRTPETFMPAIPEKQSFAPPPPASTAEALPAPMPTTARALTEREQKVVAEARRAEAAVQKKEQERAKLLAETQARADAAAKQQQDKLARDEAKRQLDAAKKQQDEAKKLQDEAAKKQAQK